MTVSLTKDSIDIGIVVKDADAALGFYRDTLGFEDTGSMPMPGGGTMHRLLCGTTLVKLVAPAPIPRPARRAVASRAPTATATGRSRCRTSRRSPSAARRPGARSSSRQRDPPRRAHRDRRGPRRQLGGVPPGDPDRPELVTNRVRRDTGGCRNVEDRRTEGCHGVVGPGRCWRSARQGFGIRRWKSTQIRLSCRQSNVRQSPGRWA